MLGISTWQRKAVAELVKTDQEASAGATPRPATIMATSAKPVTVNFAVRQLYFQVVENRWPLTAFLLAIFRPVKRADIGNLQKAVQGSIEAARTIQPGEGDVLDAFERKAFLQLTRVLFRNESISPDAATSLLKVDPSRRIGDRIRIRFNDNLKMLNTPSNIEQTPRSEANPDSTPAAVETAVDPAPEASLPPVESGESLDSEASSPAVEAGTSSESEAPADVAPAPTSQLTGALEDPPKPTAAETKEVQLSPANAENLSAVKLVSKVEYIDTPIAKLKNLN
jgi:hypothetical protein